MENPRDQADRPEQTLPKEAVEDKSAPAGCPEKTPRPETVQDQGPSHGSLWRDTIQPLLRSTVASAAAMTRYYVAHVGDLWHYLVEVTPFLEATGDRQRELRISKDDGIGSETFDGESWRLTFPDCCIVTGNKAAGPWNEETRALPDLAWPFWGAVGGLLGGLLMSLVFGRVWLWPVSFVAGLAIGYANRQSREVTLRFRRSAEAAGDTLYPMVRMFPGVLLIRVGSPAAKKVLVQERIAREARQRGGGDVTSSAGPGQSSPRKLDEPRSIPLDDPTDRPAGHRSEPPKRRDDLPPISLDDPQ